MAQYNARSTSSMLHQVHVALGGSHVDCLYNGAMDSQCGLCGALHIYRESINCCHSGKVSVPNLCVVLWIQKEDTIFSSTISSTTVPWHLHL